MQMCTKRVCCTLKNRHRCSPSFQCGTSGKLSWRTVVRWNKRFVESICWAWKSLPVQILTTEFSQFPGKHLCYSIHSGWKHRQSMSAYCWFFLTVAVVKRMFRKLCKTSGFALKDKIKILTTRPEAPTRLKTSHESRSSHLIQLENCIPPRKSKEEMVCCPLDLQIPSRTAQEVSCISRVYPQSFEEPWSSLMYNLVPMKLLLQKCHNK